MDRSDVTVCLAVVALNGGEVIDYGNGELLVIGADGRNVLLDDDARAAAMRDILDGRPDLAERNHLHGDLWRFEVTFP